MSQTPEEQGIVEPITTAEGFLSEVQKRKIKEIIRPEDAIAFAQSILSLNPPPPNDFLRRLLDSMHCATPEEFWVDINQLASNLKDFLKGDEYAAYVGPIDKSGPWALGQVLNARDQNGEPILHGPVAIFGYGQGEVNGQQVTQLGRGIIDDTIDTTLAPHDQNGIPIRILIIDDGTWSGEQLRHAHDIIFNPANPRSIVGATPYSSDSAYKGVPESRDMSMVNVRRFDSAGKHFTKEDLRWIAGVSPQSRYFAGSATPFVYKTEEGRGKTTDQVMAMVIGEERGIPPLIRPDSFTPAYR